MFFSVLGANAFYAVAVGLSSIRFLTWINSHSLKIWAGQNRKPSRPDGAVEQVVGSRQLNKKCILDFSPFRKNKTLFAKLSFDI